MLTMEFTPPKERTLGDEAYEIVDAHRREVEDHFRVEELEREFPTFARHLGSDAVFLANAADNLAGAFKWRGAFVGVHALKKEGATAAVSPSAGNALRGGALAAKSAGLDYHGVVPVSAPHQKKEGARQLYDSTRFQLHVVGNSFDESLAWALKRPDLGALLHPFDDPNVAAGQGTITDDILQSFLGWDTKHIVVPTGGGGLTAGILRRLEELNRSDILVHAVEAEGSNSLSKSLQEGRIVEADIPNSRYGGSAVRRIGDHTLSVVMGAKNVRLHTAMDHEVDMLINDYEQDRDELWRKDTPNFEPTTLVAVAGLRQVVQALPKEPTVVIGTGYNDALQPVVGPRRSFNV